MVWSLRSQCVSVNDHVKQGVSGVLDLYLGGSLEIQEILIIPGVHRGQGSTCLALPSMSVLSMHACP